MHELDPKALEAAASACFHEWVDGTDSTDNNVAMAKTAIVAYLAAAPRTPMEDELVKAARGILGHVVGKQRAVERMQAAIVKAQSKAQHDPTDREQELLSVLDIIATGRESIKRRSAGELFCVALAKGVLTGEPWRGIYRRSIKKPDTPKGKSDFIKLELIGFPEAFEKVGKSIAEGMGEDTLEAGAILPGCEIKCTRDVDGNITCEYLGGDHD